MHNSDEAEGWIILQDVELAMCNTLEHKAAVAAGIDNPQKAILEGCELSGYNGFCWWRGSCSQRIWNGATKPPYANYTRSTVKWAALGDGYRHLDALCWFNFAVTADFINKGAQVAREWEMRLWNPMCRLCKEHCKMGSIRRWLWTLRCLVLAQFCGKSLLTKC